MELKKDLIKELLASRPHLANSEIGKEYLLITKEERNPETLRKAISRFRIKLGIPNLNHQSSENTDSFKPTPPLPGKEKIEWDQNTTNNTANIKIEVSDTTIQNLEQALEFSKVDLNEWEIERHIFNTWTTSAIDKNTGDFKQINNIQVKVWFKQIGEGISGSIQEAELIKKLIENYQPRITPVKKEDIFTNDAFKRPTALLISLTDFHLDKRTLDGKTIYNKVELYERTVNNLLQKAYGSHFIDEIVYMASSDFMHTDNYQETTTKGTPQQSSVSWYDAYEIGFDLQARTINKLKQFCNKLHVIHVPSNHSKTKEYYMIHGLAMLFKDSKDIIFNRTAEPTKAYTYGNSALFFHHGNVKSLATLPQYMASKFKKEWGNSKYTECLTGDKHHVKAYRSGLVGEEINGTRTFILPSLSGSDTWHKDSGYDLAIQASVARVYDKEKGFCTEFEERP